MVPFENLMMGVYASITHWCKRSSKEEKMEYIGWAKLVTEKGHLFRGHNDITKQKYRNIQKCGIITVSIQKQISKYFVL